MVVIIGIDCATQDKNIGLALGKLSEGRLQVSKAISSLRPGGVASTLREWADPNLPTLLAIDAPLGWPQAMGATLLAHEAGKPIAVAPNLLFRRRTDVHIKERLSQQPLDVGADRIARTAHRALQLIGGLGTSLGQPIELAWDPLFHDIRAIEVYPAATLVAYKIPARSYKDEGGAEARNEILTRLCEHVTLDGDELRAACLADADVLDAVVCVLAGADFIMGRAEAPQDEDLARKEGWIWCRKLEAETPNTLGRANS